MPTRNEYGEIGGEKKADAREGVNFYVIEGFEVTY